MEKWDLKIPNRSMTEKNTQSSFLLFLGTGSSSSTPSIKCLTSDSPCGSCLDSLKNENSKNRRNNPSLLVHYEPSSIYERPLNILIDCGKTFRQSVLKICLPRRIFRLDAVILTHDHEDAISGMDDLRDIQNPTISVPLYASAHTHSKLREKFTYLCEPSKVDAVVVGRRIAKLSLHTITAGEPFYVDNLRVMPLELLHGGSYICYGYAFGSPDQVVYLSDFHLIPEKTYAALANKQIAILVIDMLRIAPHPAHPNFDQSVEVSKRFLGQSKIGAIYFVGIGHEMDHEKYNLELKKIFGSQKVELAYDGLYIPLRLSEQQAKL